MSAWVVVAVAVCTAAAARAQPADPQNRDDDREAVLRRARQHFLDGKKAFEGKRYPAAFEQFRAGYELEPKPGFLLDMAHAARKMGDLARARELYQRYLDTDPPDAGRRMAQQFARELDRKLPQAGAVAAAAPADEVEGAAPASEPPLEVPDPELVKPESLSAASSLLAPVPQTGDPSADADAPRSSSSRMWLWGSLGALAAGAAVVLILQLFGGGGDATHASGSWGQVKL